MSIDISSNAIKEWREDPVLFAKQVLDVELDDWQKQALESFSKNEKVRRVALSACAGPGKSFVLAVAAWNFLLCYAEKGEHPKGFALSMSIDNLEQNLWSELSKVQAKSKLLMHAFTWTKSRIFSNDHSATWFLQARGFSKSANKDEVGRSLSGLHSLFPFAICDEVGSIDPIILKTIEQAFGNCKNGKIIVAGNPTSKSSALYEIVSKLRDKWDVIRITGDPEDPMRSPRIDIDWARSEIERFGRDDPWIQAMILGAFPDASIDTILSVEEIEIAMSRKYHEKDFMHSQKRLGVDCARFGLDSNIISPRSGLVAFKMKEIRNVRGNDLAAIVIASKIKWGSELEFVDATGGFGASCCDAMVQAGYNPIEVQFAGKAINPKYFNKRSENWLLMAEWVKRSGCLPRDPLLAAELAAATYGFKNGKFLLAPKERIKDIIGRSPDRADALSLTFSLPDRPAMTDIQRLSNKSHKAISEFDPFRDT